MKNKLNIAWLLAPAFIAMSLHAVASTTPLQELHKLLQPIKTMQANFKQTVVGARNKVIQQASGSMQFQQPNLFRWQIDQPDPNLIVTDGKKLWNYDESLEQVVVQNYKTSDVVSPVSFLFDGVDQLNKDFSIVNLADKNKAYKCFKLTPIEENPNFTSVEVCFAKANIAELRLHDHLAQVSTFTFAQVKNNQQIAAAQFKFSAPAGVDVIGEE